MTDKRHPQHADATGFTADDPDHPQNKPTLPEQGAVRSGAPRPAAGRRIDPEPSLGEMMVAIKTISTNVHTLSAQFQAEAAANARDRTLTNEALRVLSERVTHLEGGAVPRALTLPPISPIDPGMLAPMLAKQRPPSIHDADDTDQEPSLRIITPAQAHDEQLQAFSKLRRELAESRAENAATAAAQAEREAKAQEAARENELKLLDARTKSRVQLIGAIAAAVVLVLGSVAGLAPLLAREASRQGAKQGTEEAIREELPKLPASTQPNQGHP